MSSTSSSIGRFVVELLAANGIDTVFGIPGVHNLELYRGLAGSGLRHILVRHEQSAGFAADGFARACGRPAAAFVISGPGVTNIATALAQAYSDSVPVLVIASTPERASLGKGWGVLHELRDQRALAACITGMARTALSAADVRNDLRAALAALRQPRARPAYVEIPLDVLAEPTSERGERFADPPANPPPAVHDIERAVQLLQSAQRPLLIAGGGARRALEPLRQLLEALDGYLVTTAAGKGVLPESHPGSLGASLPYRPTQDLIAAADVVLAVGTELAESDIYTSLRLEIPGRLIRIDVDTTKLSDHYAAEILIHGDARASLEAIAAAIGPRSGWRTQRGSAAAHHGEIRAQLGPIAGACSAAARALRAGLPADGAVVTDMTQIAYTGTYAFAAEHPGVWLHPFGYGTLGYALPAAIGAKLAQPERAIVALVGDFGLQFTLAELCTAVEHRLGLPVVVWNNDALGQIRDDMQRGGIAPIGVVAHNPDFVALAQACGAQAVRVRSVSALTGEVRSALERQGPTLIEIVSAGFGTA